MNIYILGYLTSAYRSNGYIKSFLNNGVNNIYVSSFNKNRSIIKKIADVLMIFKSDIIFVLPLQHNNRLLKLIIFFRKKYIVDFYISFYDSIVYDYKKFSPSSLYSKLLKRREVRILKNAELSIFLNSSEKDFYLSRLGMGNENVNSKNIPLYIPNKIERAKLRFVNSQNNIMVLCWTGTYIPLHGLEKLIEGVRIFCAEYGCDKIKVVFWGDSNTKSKPYRDLVTNYKLENVVTFNNKSWGDFEEWTNFMVNNCDVTLGVFGDSRKSKTVLPNKVVDGISLRTPVLTQQSEAINEFAIDDCIYTVKNSAEDIAQGIYKIYCSNSETINKKVEKAYTIYQHNFTYEKFDEKVRKDILPYLCSDKIK